ncbi:glycine cleavage system aminomethyltransferase GcvT [uncultured Muribaculum sp.]|jgi:aminomethyltransferase|uniref:glycine cleavage system aminomethyltransferase GcvT n=1 Tax=uncultured Muribaculum sp. TaxID=1918613 RepID=UPI0025B01BBE|nr:glycine cleavage system aminomethyltransferase GcvT [uncultured Muribaculum sp.]
MEDNKRTCLYDKHVGLGALMSPFGGFEMPIQYKGIIEEHQAVRNGCGVFDVSHMGEVLVSGKDAEAFVNYIFTNDVTDAKPGKCFYGMMLNHTGGVVDDLLVYCKDRENFFLVINASNIDKDVAWIRENSEKFNVNIEHLSDSLGELAIQGPKAESIVGTVLELPCADLEFYSFKEIESDGETIILSRTGYTGEDGFEVYASHALINKFWDKLIASGNVEPCGLGCRDTLRFEVGLPLYGNELSDSVSPLEAGLGIFVKLDKPEFIGREATAKIKAEGAKRKTVGIELEDKAVPRHGYEVLSADGSKVIGHVTTGYHAISVDKSIAMALVDAEYSALGTPVLIKIRKKTFPGQIVKKKFYKKSYKN